MSRIPAVRRPRKKPDAAGRDQHDADDPQERDRGPSYNDRHQLGEKCDLHTWSTSEQILPSRYPLRNPLNQFGRPMTWRAFARIAVAAAGLLSRKPPRRVAKRQLTREADDHPSGARWSGVPEKSTAVSCETSATLQMIARVSGTETCRGGVWRRRQGGGSAIRVASALTPANEFLSTSCARRLSGLSKSLGLRFLKIRESRC